jgi:predicted phosphate transport protein (TIGR00153 family)
MLNFRLLPRDQRFFDSFERATAVMRRATVVLVDIMERYEDVPAKLARLEALEHEGDQTTHALMQSLHQTFVTPLDRDDITALAQRLDDVTDPIWAAADRLRVFKIERITPAAQGMARVLERQASVLEEAVPLLRDGRRLSAILPHTVEINRLENEVDELLRSGISQLFAHPDDPRDIVLSIKWREIYEFLEMASDKAEDAANVLEGIVIKHA